MKITDLNGYSIEIQNLDEAIKISADTRNTSAKTRVFRSSIKDRKPIGRICLRN